MSIAIVVLTYNRVHLLRQCVENTLGRVSQETREIVIWNNGSTDGTRAYLDGLDEPRTRVVHHPRNIGQSGYKPAFESTVSDYLVELDDDIIEAPQGWDETLLEAIQKLPKYGFLAANLVNNPHDVTARIMYGPAADRYRIVEVEGVRLKLGPTGGGCAMTPRRVYDEAGGFRQNRKSVFWQEEAAYIKDIQKVGYEPAILNDLEVLHAGGEYYAPRSPEKVEYWKAYRRRMENKRRAKRVLLRLPMVRRLNDRFRWFTVPGQRQRVS
jgi:GT2 family glycosyltransferase